MIVLTSLNMVVLRSMDKLAWEGGHFVRGLAQSSIGMTLERCAPSLLLCKAVLGLGRLSRVGLAFL